jgi:hypothetical protein
MGGKEFRNQSWDFHYRVIRKEMHRFCLISGFAALASRVVEQFLGKVDREPY